MGKKINEGAAHQKAEELRISQIGDFKQRLGGIQELPSGFVVKVKNPGGLRAFLGSKTIPNSLMSIIQTALDKGKAPSTSAFQNEKGEFDPELMADMNDFLDVVVMASIVEPKIHPKLGQADLDAFNKDLPEDEQIDDVELLRDDNTFYVDELPDDDKQFIFQWISGGTRDLERFRQELEKRMDSLLPGKGPSSTT